MIRFFFALRSFLFPEKDSLVEEIQCTANADSTIYILSQLKNTITFQLPTF